jgi:hypothetical protein
MFWARRLTSPERRLAGVRRELQLVHSDLRALGRTVRSGGQVAIPEALRSREWRNRQTAAAAEAEALPDWFPKPVSKPEPRRSDRGFVRDERFVDYLASNYQPGPDSVGEGDDGNGRTITIALVVVLIVVWIVALRLL